jgi:Protein of unknown function (DUF1360)
MKLPVWAWLLVDALSVYRLTRLVVADTITEPVRGWVRFQGWDAGATPRETGRVARALFHWMTCAWCVSIWTAALVVVLTFNARGWWGYVALALAFSVVAGLLALVGD